MKLFTLSLMTAAIAAPACSSKTPDDGPDTKIETRAPTWHQDVAPLVTEKCVGCHQDSGIAPFSMQSYSEAVRWASAMAQETAAGNMPPFLAEDTEECVPRYGWKNDIRLTAAQKAMIKAWADADAPEGDPETAAKLPQAVSLTMQEPDVSLKIPSSAIVDGNRDQFLCFVIDTKLEEDRWFNSMQINAGNAKIVHHVLVYNDVNLALDAQRVADGRYECFGGTGVTGASLVSAWAPGAIPFETPPDVAFQLKKDARLILQVHYHPTGAPETDDSTGIDLKYAPGRPKYSTAVNLIGNFTSPVVVGGLLPGPNDPPEAIEFKIAAGAKDHLESMRFNVTGENDMVLWSAATHMHYVGRSMSVHLKHAAPVGDEPAQECLIHTPNWNFNWQRGYAYDAPLDQVPVAHTGDTFLFQCRYDNSLDNPHVREALRQQGLTAPRDVFMGEATLDEMCLGSIGVATKLAEE
jgi:hypothetical protein